MGVEDKIEKLLRISASYSFDDLQSLMSCLGYTMKNRGKTSGSAVCFIKQSTGAIFRMHRPHPEKEVCKAAQRDLIKHLREKGEIDG